MPQPTVRSRFAFTVLAPLALARDVCRSVSRRFRLMLLRHRPHLISSRGRPYSSPHPQKKLLVAITHVVSPATLPSEEARHARLTYLSAAIDSVLRSFAHHEVTIVLNTYKGLNLLDSLPAGKRGRCRVVEHGSGDPMMIEFAVSDLFIEEKANFDWFLFIEDDIAIHDTSFIEKIEEFNRCSGAPGVLLLPHRFEMNDGRKIYIDRDFGNKLMQGPKGSDVEDIVNPMTEIEYTAANGRRLRFAEFTNPHAACYCLSKDQLSAWERTGRHWHNRVVWIGPLESAATGTLFEAFDLYKPHPDNKWHLEVEHLDPKYSARLKAALAGSAGFPVKPAP